MPREIDPGAFTAGEVLRQQGETFVASLFGRGWSEDQIFRRIQEYYPLLGPADRLEVFNAGFDLFEQKHAAVANRLDVNIPFSEFQLTPGLPPNTLIVFSDVIVVDVTGREARRGQVACNHGQKYDPTYQEDCVTAFAEMLAAGMSPEMEYWYVAAQIAERGPFFGK